MEKEFTNPERQEFDRRSAELADILRDFEEYGFDSETIDEISKMPFEETDESDGAFATAYNYLMQMGFDADEVLARFMEEE